MEGITVKPLWDKTTDKYKSINMKALLKYTKSETKRNQVDALYRNLYEKYGGKK